MVYHRRLKRTVVPLVLAGLLNPAISPLHGQTLKGTVLGTITDRTQAVVSGAHVSVS